MAETRLPRPELSSAELPKVQPNDSEYTLSLVGLITSLAGQPIVGLILSAIALKQSKQAKRSNLMALLGLIFGCVFVGIGLLFGLLYGVVLFIVFISSAFLD